MLLHLIYLLLQKSCKVHLIFVKMSPVNLLEIILADLLDTLYHWLLIFPLPSSRHHLSYDDCLEDKRENYQNCSVLCCV